MECLPVDRSRPNKVCGWFLSHAKTDPSQEIDKILRVSGSPYEEQSGSHRNDDHTAAEEVFVINRYDWGDYDKRCKDEFGEVADEQDDPIGGYNSLGVVNYAQARATVLRWKEQRSLNREWRRDSAWLYNPGEYMFGRFGFTADKKAARSFLFFSTYTDFTQTRLAESTQTLRKAESEEERFQRRLREGRDFSGLQMLHGCSEPPTGLRRPYNLTEHILAGSDIEAARAFSSVTRLPRITEERGLPHYPSRQFAKGLEEPMFDLINEMFLSWLDRCILSKPPDSKADTYFPNYQDPSHIDRESHRCFQNVDQEPIANFDTAGICDRIGTLLRSRSWPANEHLIAGLCRVIEHLLLKVVDLASKIVGEVWITPQDFRMALLYDHQLFEKFGVSKVYWEGRG